MPVVSPLSVQEWYHSGERLAVTPTGFPTRNVFVRRTGRGPVVTLLHGFPTSSWDWARVAALLEAERTVVTLDLLGYGESDKPWKHAYSTAEHASIVEAVWREFDVDSTVVVGHDVGTSITQELLARDRDGALAVDLRGVAMVNGALFTDHYRPKRVTRMLAGPITGPLLARVMNRDRYVASLAELFSDQGRPDESELAAHWDLLARRSGQRVLPGLVHYLADKQANDARWSTATRETRVPTTVIWGELDPAIGLDVLADICRYLPGAAVLKIPDAGHFPHVERPQLVARAIGDLA